MKLVCDYPLNTKKKIVEFKVASLTINIVFGANSKSNKPQNGPTFHVHASQVFHNRKKKRIHCCNIYIYIYIYEATNVTKNLKQSCEIDLQIKFQ
jgi:hypothetical protein